MYKNHKILHRQCCKADMAAVLNTQAIGLIKLTDRVSIFLVYKEKPFLKRKGLQLSQCNNRYLFQQFD